MKIAHYIVNLIIFTCLLVGSINTAIGQNDGSRSTELFHGNWEKHRRQDSISRARVLRLEAVKEEINTKGYYSKNTCYIYYDALRQAGFGYRRSLSPYFDINVEGDTLA